MDCTNGDTVTVSLQGEFVVLALKMFFDTVKPSDKHFFGRALKTLSDRRTSTTIYFYGRDVKSKVQ